MTLVREFTDIEDIGDWVRASKGDTTADPFGNPVMPRGMELITRRFSPDMSLRMVRRLCQEWHEAIANNMREGELVKFPVPWIAGADFGGHKIVPITDSRELYLASKKLHNCAASEYREPILDGRASLYTVSNGDGALIVMVELYREESGALRLGQVKEYCNAPAPKEIEREVRRWFRSHERSSQ